MRKYSGNKDINKLVRGLRKIGWIFRKGKTHGVVISPVGEKLAVPCSPSDRRAFNNFRNDIRKLEKGIKLYVS